jgi:hypothetical protein
MHAARQRLEVARDFVREVAREPVVAFHAAWIELCDWLMGPRPDLGNTRALQRYFRTQASEREPPGCWAPRDRS